MTSSPPIAPDQARAARKLLGWTQRYAGERSSTSAFVIYQAERGIFTEATTARLRAAYEAAGVEFTNGNQPGVAREARVTESFTWTSR